MLDSFGDGVVRAHVRSDVGGKYGSGDICTIVGFVVGSAVVEDVDGKSVTQR